MTIQAPARGTRVPVSATGMTMRGCWLDHAQIRQRRQGRKACRHRPTVHVGRFSLDVLKATAQVAVGGDGTVASDVPRESSRRRKPHTHRYCSVVMEPSESGMPRIPAPALRPKPFESTMSLRAPCTRNG